MNKVWHTNYFKRWQTLKEHFGITLLLLKNGEMDVKGLQTKSMPAYHRQHPHIYYHRYEYIAPGEPSHNDFRTEMGQEKLLWMP